MGGVVWQSDSQCLLYLTVNDEWRPDKVWRLTPFDDTADELRYQEQDGGFFLGLDLTQSEAWVMLTSGSHTENETHLIDRADLAGELHCVRPRQDGHEYYIDHRTSDGANGEFLIRSNQRQPNFDLYRTADIYAPWQPWIEGNTRTYLTGHLALQDQTVITQRTDGLDQIRIVCGAEDYCIDFPEAAYSVDLGINPEPQTAALRLHYTSMVTPATTYDYDFSTRILNVRKVQQIPSGYDATQYRTERLTATARDGAQIPISVVYHHTTPLDGTAPLYLYGYGAYGHAIPPSFGSARISLLDRGLIFAIAHIRGGDDLGYDWYTAGKLNQRTNTFNDFVDCARYLIDAQLTHAGRIAIAGGSAGGELMGAVVNQAPQLWGAVAAHVPFVDVLNTMLDGSLPLTPMEWPEWGNPLTDKDVFDYIRSYSPYDQLSAKDYPPLFVTAGLNDPRVTYWEPAKYVAKIRHLMTNDATVLLKTNMGAGHGGVSGRFQALREVAEEYAFILQELGLLAD